MAVSLFGTGNKKKQIPGKEISSVLTMPVGQSSADLQLCSSGGQGMRSVLEKNLGVSVTQKEHLINQQTAELCGAHISYRVYRMKICTRCVQRKIWLEKLQKNIPRSGKKVKRYSGHFLCAKYFFSNASLIPPKTVGHFSFPHIVEEKSESESW